MPLGPFHDTEEIVREREQDYDIPLNDGIMQPLTPKTDHITPPDDDYVALATNLIFDKQLNKFEEEFFDITKVAEKENDNPVKDVMELSNIKTYDCETFIWKLLHQGIKSLLKDEDYLMFSANLLHFICLEAMLSEFLVLILLFPFYFISLMYNMDIPDTQFEGEEVKTMMGPTMEKYMTTTHDGYGQGVVRPKIDDKVNFEIRGQFLKELRHNTFSGSEPEDPNEHIKKEVIAFYKGLDAPTRLTLESRGAIPTMKVADTKKATHEMADYSQKWHDGTSNRKKGTETSDGLAAIQA
ncbi:hypothetical protein Tco_1499480 [Tanacetum coccineum]